jgi:hypothetical protein
MSVRESERRGTGFPLEVAVVWAMFTVVTIAVFVTYWRLPPQDLYHVSGSGLTGGASRALVYLNFPVALAAIPILILLSQRLPGRLVWAMAAGIVLSAAVFWPGIVDQADLDARLVNAIAAIGVLVAVLLTAVAAWRSGRIERRGRLPGDPARFAVAGVVVLLALPWIAAELGFSFNGVPVLGTLYQTGELRSQPHMAELHPAVHHGDHHGLSGTLLVLTALLLSRVLPSIGRRWVRGVLGAYLALLLCYGFGNIANDFWLEQVTKRGWTNWQIPDVTTPKATWAWGIIVLSAAAIWCLSAWRATRPRRPFTALGVQ